MSLDSFFVLVILVFIDYFGLCMVCECEFNDFSFGRLRMEYGILGIRVIYFGSFGLVEILL